MKKWLIMLITVLSIPAYAINDEAGRSGADFLRIGVGARPAAMGSAYCGLVDDVSSIYWNPAGLGKAEAKEATFMHNSWLSGINYEYLAGILPISNSQGLGASFSFLDPGKVERTTISNHEGDGSKFGGHNYAMTLSYGKRLSKALSCGLSLKYIREEIDKFSASGFGADLAGLYETPIENLTIGAMLSNLGTKMKFVKKEDRLPLKFNVGAGYRMKKLNLALDLNKPIDNDLSAGIGGEWRMIDSLSFRFGYNSGADEGPGISAGLGFMFKNLQLDYAYLPGGDLNDVHWISLSARHGKRPEVSKVEIVSKEKPETVPQKVIKAEINNLRMEIKPLLHPEYSKFYLRVENTLGVPVVFSPYDFTLQTRDGEYHRLFTETFSQERPLLAGYLFLDQALEGHILFETKEPSRKLIYKDYSGNYIEVDF